MPKTVGAPKGNKNAVSKRGANDDHVHVRCRSADKKRWMSQAKRKGQTLSAWIVETLNGG